VIPVVAEVLRSGQRATAPLVSVVISTKNHATLLPDTIQAVLAQDIVDPIELIVVDNASTDDTAAILEGVKDRIRILHEDTRGPAAARNCGIRAARGDCIALTDADCVVDPDWLMELVQPLGSAEVGISGGRILSVAPCNRIERFGETIHDHRRALEEFDPPYAISMNWASRRSVLLDIGLFDETLLRDEDVDLAWRIRAAGFRLVYRHAALIYHRNERTLRGLLAEGYAHGYFAVALRRKHEIGGYSPLRPLVRAAAGVLRGADRRDSFYAFVFDLGKAIGHFSASARPGARTETRA
jgi:glycosyltransferase involved in cell wall biosynthesis